MVAVRKLGKSPGSSYDHQSKWFLRWARSLGWSFLFTVLWNTINHGRHNIFWSFRSKALQTVKKIKNPCRFRVWNLFLTFCNPFDLNDQKMLCLPWFIWFQRKPGFETTLMTTHTHSKWFLSRNEKIVWQIQIQSNNNDF